MDDYYMNVVNASVELLRSLGYRVFQPKPTKHEKEIIIKAMEQSYMGNRRDLYKTLKGKWSLTYSKSGLFDIGQVHQDTVNELIEDGTVELTYHNTKGCYTLKGRGGLYQVRTDKEG